jgi:hypothetical protein
MNPDDHISFREVINLPSWIARKRNRCLVRTCHGSIREASKVELALLSGSVFERHEMASLLFFDWVVEEL